MSKISRKTIIIDQNQRTPVFSMDFMKTKKTLTTVDKTPDCITDKTSYNVYDYSSNTKDVVSLFAPNVSKPDVI